MKIRNKILIVLLFTIFFSFRFVTNFSKLFRLKAKNFKLESKMEHLENRNNKINKEIDLLKSKNASEEIARLKYGMIKNGENFYQIVPNRTDHV